MCFQTTKKGYMCGLMNGRRGYIPKTSKKRNNIWSARKARWRRWRKFGVDWDYVESKLKIIDIMRSKRHETVSNKKCKKNDAENRPIRKF